MKIKKIIREEIQDFDWAQDNSISGDELRYLLLKTKVNTIPFEIVGGNLYLVGSKVKDLGQLQSVGGDLDLFWTKIESLGQLKSVGGNLNLVGTQVKDLGQLKTVGGSLGLRGTEVKDLGQLKTVGGDLVLRGTPLAELYSEEEIRSMIYVGGNIYL